MVWQRVAVNLGVDPTTVWRTVSLFRSTGGMQKKRYPRGKAFTVLSPALECTIVHLVLMRPGVKFKLNLQNRLEQTYHLLPSGGSCTELALLGKG